MAQPQIGQQQLAQTQMAQAQMAQTQMAQTQLAQNQMAQTQMAQNQMAQNQLAQQQMAQNQMVQTQMGQTQNMGQPHMIQIAQPQMGQTQLGQHIVHPQMAQQMMYCPVRLVYDHSVLVQPGKNILSDQIQQQNQNIFVNQPPWARPVQNQVIYVQQIGPNLVPIQNIDPNLYLQQNTPTYQQVLPQIMQQIPQTQIRPVVNNIQANLMQNFAQMPTVQDQNLGQVVQNYTYVQNVQTNPDGNVNANNSNTANNTNTQNNANSEVDRQMAIANQNAMQNNQETQQQIFRQIPQQMTLQQMLARPQIPMQINQAQNLAHTQPIATQTAQAVMQNNANVVQNISVNNIRTSNAVTNNVQQNVNVTAQTMQGSVTQNVIANNRIIGTHVMQNPAQNQNLLRANTPTNICTNMNMNIGQNVAVNIPQVRQILSNQHFNYATQNVQQTVATPVNTSTVDRNISAANMGNLNTVTYSAVRNGQPYMYRAIQPKPNVNIRVNFAPRVAQVPMVRKPVPNLVNKNVVNVSTTATNTNYVKTEPNNQNINRKRKSESPDEIQKKISNFGTMTVTSQVKDKLKAKYATTTSEMGTNTSPVHKPEKKIEAVQPILQVNPMETKVIKEEIRSPVHSMPVLQARLEAPIKIEPFPDIMKKDTKDQQSETEKLVRKTVFPQARNRLLEDKLNLSNIKTEMDPKTSVNKNDAPNVAEVKNDQSQSIDKNVKVEEAKSLPNLLSNFSDIYSKTDTYLSDKKVLPSTKDSASEQMDIVKAAETLEMIKNESQAAINRIEITPIVLPSKPEENKLDIDKTLKENIVKINTKIVADLKENKTDVAEEKTEDAPPSTEEVAKETKVEKMEYKNVSISEMTGKELLIVDGNIQKKERDYILTHVLDGYVIQESNVPFAIRKPLKERTINAVAGEKQEFKSGLLKEDIKEKIYDLSQLNLEEERDAEMKEAESKEKKADDIKIDEETKMEEGGEENVVTQDNPFQGLQPDVVKTWTVDQLSSHLASHNWPETVSLFQEHEIDGESLFLVTKNQLVTIGVTENHADIICEFLGKG